MAAEERAISFAGWSPAAAQATAITVDVDEVIGRLDALDDWYTTRGVTPREPDDEPHFRRMVAEMSPEDPAIGRWAAVVLEEDFEEAQRALAPLLARRADIALPMDPGVAGAPGLIAMRRPASATPERWRKSLSEATAGGPPHYLLLVGGPDRFPFEVQVALEQRHATGRLDAGSAPRGAMDWGACGAWAEKLVRYEEGCLPVDPRALVYSFATDAATKRSHAELSVPLAAWLNGSGRRLPSTPGEPQKLFGDEATTAGLCAALAASSPALLVTASHGFECFDASDATADQDRWGALTDADFVGKNGTPLDAARVRAAASFAPGAVMLSFACFSAGVPEESVHRALTEKKEGAIPGGPFTAALPRALLAHPAGPIAFVGHVDRATSESFRPRPRETVPPGFLDFTAWSLGGTGTLGQAMSGFREGCGEAAQSLADGLARARKRPELGAAKAAIDAWVRYHDAAGYILLGDPVTQLAVPRRR